jgi:hypothetical protein
MEKNTYSSDNVWDLRKGRLLGNLLLHGKQSCFVDRRLR